MDQMESCVPPGFRFHPTEEELVGYYLKRKINSLKIDLDVIIDIDLYRMEPWDIQDRCKLGYDEQKEWYFFSHKDRKYPTGTRTNRATTAGFWKATGRDKAVVSKERIIGMRKTLVFYKGRAPNGRKTDWIMHEYRLQTSEHGPPQEEGWVVCRAFKKPSPSHKQGFESWNNSNYYTTYRPPSYPSFINIQSTNFHHQPPLIQPPIKSTADHSPFDQSCQNMANDLPKLESPSISTSNFAANEEISTEDDQKSNFGGTSYQFSDDWNGFDNLVASAGSSSSYNAYANMALVAPHSDEFGDAHDHLGHVLECFPDL